MATLATVIIEEKNGAPAGADTTATNSNMGITDSPNLTPILADAIPAGTNSMEKYQRVRVTVNGDSNVIQGIRIWRTGTLGGADVHLCNCRTAAQTGYAGAAVYASPAVATSSKAVFTMATADPTATNLGIAGSLTGTISTTGYSDYLVHQIQVGAGTTAGPASPNYMYYQYDEIA
jgi:hypothetical protein